MHGPQASAEQRIQVAADKDQAWVLDFPLPERPARIQHGKADGFNFGGSLGMVYEVSSSGTVCGRADTGSHPLALHVARVAAVRRRRQPCALRQHQTRHAMQLLHGGYPVLHCNTSGPRAAAYVTASIRIWFYKQAA